MKKGMRTGLVASSMITDATPASFSAHVDHRSKQADIAYQQIKTINDLFGGNKGYGMDVIMGGGRAYYLPKENSGSLRTDSTNVIEVSLEMM